jgi:hypothetical protein
MTLRRIDAESDRVLGFTVFGAEAGEVIACRERRVPLHRIAIPSLPIRKLLEGLTVLFQ